MSGFHKFVCVSIVVAALVACLWDYDTTLMERSRFPDALELITGKFPRHSPEFYEWRIEDRKQRLQSEPDNLALYDDIAVAFDKLGNHEAAISWALKKEEIQPGIYETAANLGTFYIHNGEMREGLKHIYRAIEINPDAHFGREIYQAKLVEFVLARKEGSPTLKLPLNNKFRSRHFGYFCLDDQQRDLDFIRKKDEYQKIANGIAGMMRFGHYDSPVLLEVYGALLCHLGNERLGARAFLKASYETTGEVRQAYRDMADEALFGQVVDWEHNRLTLEHLEKIFQKELEEADKWYNEVRQDELQWIQQGKEVDEEFRRKYFDDVQVSDYGIRMPPKKMLVPWHLGEKRILLLTAIVALTTIVGVLWWRTKLATT